MSEYRASRRPAAAIDGPPTPGVAPAESLVAGDHPRRSALEEEVDLAINSMAAADAQARATVVDRAFRLAICNAHLGRFDEARLWRGRALELLRRMRREDMELLHFQAEARAAIQIAGLGAAPTSLTPGAQTRSPQIRAGD